MYFLHRRRESDITSFQRSEVARARKTANQRPLPSVRHQRSFFESRVFVRSSRNKTRFITSIDSTLGLMNFLGIETSVLKYDNPEIFKKQTTTSLYSTLKSKEGLEHFTKNIRGHNNSQLEKISALKKGVFDDIGLGLYRQELAEAELVATARDVIKTVNQAISRHDVSEEEIKKIIANTLDYLNEKGINPSYLASLGIVTAAGILASLKNKNLQKGVLVVTLFLGACSSGYTPPGIIQEIQAPTQLPGEILQTAEENEALEGIFQTPQGKVETVIPSGLTFSTQEASDAVLCGIDSASVLFQEGLTPDTMTVPVLSQAGLEATFGNQADLQALTSSVADKVFKVIDSVNGSVKEFIIPEYINPEDVRNNVAQLLGVNPEELRVDIKKWDPANTNPITGEDKALIAVHAGKNGWVTEIWGNPNLATRSDGSFKIKGTLRKVRIDEQGLRYYDSIPEREEDIAIVDGCSPVIVSVGNDGTKVQEILNPNRDISDQSTAWLTEEQVFKIQPTEVQTAPEVSKELLEESLDLIEGIPVRENGEGDWVLLDKLGRVFFRWDPETNQWLDKRPLYWQCGRGVLPNSRFDSFNPPVLPNDEVLKLPTGLRSEEKTVIGGTNEVRGYKVRACLTEIDSSPGQIYINGKVVFFDLDGKSHEYPVRMGSIFGDEFVIAFGRKLTFKLTHFEEGLKVLKLFWYDSSFIASRQVDLDIGTQDYGNPIFEGDLVNTNRETTLQIIEAMRNGRGFPEEVPEDFFLWAFLVYFVSESQAVRPFFTNP